MTGKPRVSVIMGLYNCEQTLSCAIDSILDQTYSDFELIMCNDGSTDATFDIAQAYQKKDPNRICLIQNEKNMGLAYSLNHCLEVAVGEYIARMDSDDIALPERLFEEVRFLDSHPSIHCVGTGRYIFDGSDVKGISMGKEHPTMNDLKYGPPFAHPTILIRKTVLDKLKGYSVIRETRRCEDLDLWFRFFKAGYCGYNIQIPLLKYRESILDYKRRTISAAIGITKVNIRGFKLLGFPWYSYIWCFKPVLSAVLPKRLMQRFHSSFQKKN